MYSAILMMTLAVQPVILDRDEQARQPCPACNGVGGTYVFTRGSMYPELIPCDVCRGSGYIYTGQSDGPKKMPKCTCMNDGSACICAQGRCSCEVGDYKKPQEGKKAVVFVGIKPRHVDGFIVQKSGDLKHFGLSGPGIVVWDGKQRIDLPPNASNEQIRRAAAPRMESGADGGQRLQPMFVGSPRSSRGGC